MAGDDKISLKDDPTFLASNTRKMVVQFMEIKRQRSIFGVEIGGKDQEF